MFSCAGFVKLKMQNKLGAPVAFVDFKVYVEKKSHSSCAPDFHFNLFPLNQ
jgi:hypothetical protein